jgi:uncharacterized protein (TIGR03435 family)
MALAFGLTGARSQTVQPPAAAFDASSVKPAKPDARGYSIRPLPGRVSAENVTLKLLIGEAYHVYDFQISGGPKWIDADRYDVEAKVGGGIAPSKTQLRVMLQKLLADRFSLKVRHELREMPVYLLVSGKGGPKLQSSKDPAKQTVFRVFQRRQITAENAPLEELANTLTWLVGKPVLDRTGLQGTFDYKLEWSPDELQMPSTEAPPQTNENAPSLNGALQQLGLKLVSQKDSLDVLVLERAEKPTAN